MSADEKTTGQEPLPAVSDFGKQAEAYIRCVNDEKKTRLDEIIAQLKSGPPGWGRLSDPTPEQENQAEESAMDACEHLPGSKYFQRTR